MLVVQRSSQMHGRSGCSKRRGWKQVTRLSCCRSSLVKPRQTRRFACSIAMRSTSSHSLPGEHSSRNFVPFRWRDRSSTCRQRASGWLSFEWKEVDPWSYCRYFVARTVVGCNGNPLMPALPSMVNDSQGRSRSVAFRPDSSVRRCPDRRALRTRPVRAVPRP